MENNVAFASKQERKLEKTEEEDGDKHHERKNCSEQKLRKVIDFLAMHFTVFHKTNESHNEGWEGVDAVQYEENIFRGRCLPDPKKISVLAKYIEESNKSGNCRSKKKNSM